MNLMVNLLLLQVFFILLIKHLWELNSFLLHGVMKCGSKQGARCRLVLRAPAEVKFPHESSAKRTPLVSSEKSERLIFRQSYSETTLSVVEWAEWVVTLGVFWPSKAIRLTGCAPEECVVDSSSRSVPLPILLPSCLFGITS